MPTIYHIEEPKTKDPRVGRYTLTFTPADWDLLVRLRVVAAKEKRSLRNLIVVALSEWLEGR